MTADMENTVEPVKTNKESAGTKKKKPPRQYEITVHRKGPSDPPFIDIQVNGGGATRIRLGEKVQVGEEDMEVLRNAQETTYRFFADPNMPGGEAHEEQTSPLNPITVHREI